MGASRCSQGCHTSSTATALHRVQSFYGQPLGQAVLFPTLIWRPGSMARVSAGTVVAAECCYGAELYDPAPCRQSTDRKFAIPIWRMKGMVFFGSTTIAYGPANGNASADLICQYFPAASHRRLITRGELRWRRVSNSRSHPRLSARRALIRHLRNLICWATRLYSQSQFPALARRYSNERCDCWGCCASSDDRPRIVPPAASACLFRGNWHRGDSSHRHNPHRR